MDLYLCVWSCGPGGYRVFHYCRERLQGQAAAEGLLLPGLSDAGGGPCDVTDAQSAERDRLHEVHKVGDTPGPAAPGAQGG